MNSGIISPANHIWDFHVSSGKKKKKERDKAWNLNKQLNILINMLDKRNEINGLYYLVVKSNPTNS